MSTEDEALRIKLSKLEALFARAGTDGEREAAGAAIQRLQSRIGTVNTETELKFSLPDTWSLRLFVAVCRKHDLLPYRYPRQRRTTVMLKTSEELISTIVWPEFSSLQSELQHYFESTVDHLIKTAMHSDGDDSDLEISMLRN